MNETNDAVMQHLLTAKRKGTKIFYGRKYTETGELSTAEPTTVVETDHAWDVSNNVYMIRHRREYIISIDDRNKDNPEITYTENNWTRSDFGKTEMGEYILMREVYPEEM